MLQHEVGCEVDRCIRNCFLLCATVVHQGAGLQLWVLEFVPEFPVFRVCLFELVCDFGCDFVCDVV